MPSSVSKLSVDVLTDSLVVVEWSSPVPAQGPIEDYLITYRAKSKNNNGNKRSRRGEVIIFYCEIKLNASCHIRRSLRISHLFLITELLLIKFLLRYQVSEPVLSSSGPKEESFFAV